MLPLNPVIFVTFKVDKRIAFIQKNIDARIKLITQMGRIQPSLGKPPLWQNGILSSPKILRLSLVFESQREACGSTS